MLNLSKPLGSEKHSGGENQDGAGNHFHSGILLKAACMSRTLKLSDARISARPLQRFVG
ncbi:MAG: hypothetical protein ACRDD1_20970 [Planctomycetia bacterium]